MVSHDARMRWPRSSGPDGCWSISQPSIPAERATGAHLLTPHCLQYDSVPKGKSKNLGGIPKASQKKTVTLNFWPMFYHAIWEVVWVVYVLTLSSIALFIPCLKRLCTSFCDNIISQGANLVRQSCERPGIVCRAATAHGGGACARFQACPASGMHVPVSCCRSRCLPATAAPAT